MIELLIGLTLAVMGALTIFSLSTFSAKISKEAEARSVAYSIARMKLEELCATSQSNRNLANHVSFDVPPLLAQQFRQVGGKSFDATYSVKNVPDAPNLQQLTVIVTWSNMASRGDGAKSSVSLSKIVCSAGYMEDTPYKGGSTDPIDTYFYTPPPPPPPSGSTAGEPGTSTGGGSSGSTDGGSTGGSPPPDPPPADPTSGGDSGGGGSDSGGTSSGTDGSSGGSSGGSGGTTGSSSAAPVFNGGYGYKW